MDTVVPPRDDSELHLLTEWGTLRDQSRSRKAGALSLLVHAVLISLLLLVPAGLVEPPERRPEPERVTPLVEPPTELTQKAPNLHKPAKEFNEAELAPRERIQLPAGAPSTRRAQARRLAEIPGPVLPKPSDLPEPPKLEASTPKPVAPAIPQFTPQIEPVEQPKLAFQNVPPPPAPAPPAQRKIPIPNPSVAEAVRQSTRKGAGGGLIVGDPELSGPGGVGEGINLPPSPGVQGSQLELLSDPMGVDFRPYLLQVLAAVRRNWMAVMPESARMGRQGRVTIQFSIGRDGYVPKLVITGQSGTEALDRAAVSGISAAQTFPPFPAGFKGDRIVLQFNFAYNMPRR